MLKPTCSAIWNIWAERATLPLNKYPQTRETPKKRLPDLCLGYETYLDRLKPFFARHRRVRGELTQINKLANHFSNLCFESFFKPLAGRRSNRASMNVL